jgi:hypothetical protein
MKKLSLSKEVLMNLQGGLGGGGGFTVGLCHTRDFRCTDKATDLCTAGTASCPISCELKCWSDIVGGCAIRP